jgi:hypothetical protein
MLKQFILKDYNYTLSLQTIITDNKNQYYKHGMGPTGKPSIKKMGRSIKQQLISTRCIPKTSLTTFLMRLTDHKLACPLTLPLFPFSLTPYFSTYRIGTTGL